MDNFNPLLYIYECSKIIVTFHDKNFISRNTREADKIFITFVDSEKIEFTNIYFFAISKYL